jgi:hypothetical protein
VPVEVCPESEDLAPAGRAAGVDGDGGEHGETVPVSCSISALVPRGGRQQAVEGPPWRRARALVGEGDDSEAEAGSRDVDEEAVSGRGQAAAAERISTAEEEREEGWEDDEEKDQREEATEAGAVATGAARPYGHRQPSGGSQPASQRTAAVLDADRWRLRFFFSKLQTS